MNTKAVSSTLRLLAELVGAVLLTLSILMVLGSALAWGLRYWH